MYNKKNLAMLYNVKVIIEDAETGYVLPTESHTVRTFNNVDDAIELKEMIVETIQGTNL